MAKKIKDPRRLLFLDIETSPSLVYTFQFWNVNISPDKIVEAGGLLCFAYSWNDDTKVHFVEGDFAEVTKKAWDLLTEADVLVTYNGDKFDIPHLQRAFTQEGLPSPKPFHSVDLFRVIKREQRGGVWPSLKLGYLAQELGLSGKAPNDGFQLWIDYMAGEERARRQMERYNKRDVAVLKEMWPLLQHKIKNLPSASLYMDTDELVCPNCGSDHYQSRGVKRSKTRSYRQYQCQKCLSWFRSSRSSDSAGVTP